jgi:hypothetical protein
MTIPGSITARGAMPYWGLWLALGIVEVALSFWLLQQPGLTLLSAVLAIGFWSICYGIVAISASIELKALPQRIDEAQCPLARATPSSAFPRFTPGDTRTVGMRAPPRVPGHAPRGLTCQPR